jgi:hypothetical protein
MTSNLHAHVDTSSRDCDGPQYNSWVTSLNDDEIAEHEKAQGINDFHDLHFKARVLSHHVSFHAEGEVHYYPEGFTVSEPHDEGYHNVEVRWCEDEDCDPNARSHRDVYAEMMGY